jgi:hypothetical protein
MLAELEKMWEEFNLVHFENSGLNSPFYNWEKGTQMTHILDWFNSNLIDVFYDNRFSLPILENMWEEFGDIPINDDDEIEQDFYCWEKGTDRFVPKKSGWHWFDEKLPNGITIDFNLI